MQELCKLSNMAIRVSKRHLMFAEPMGARHVHLVQCNAQPGASSRDFMEPMMLLKEVPARIFGGPGCFKPASISTLVTCMGEVSTQSRVHAERTTDRAIITNLAAAGLLAGSRATAVTLLSLPFLVALMKSIECKPHHLRPVEMMCEQRQQVMLTNQAPLPTPAPLLSNLPPGKPIAHLIWHSSTQQHCKPR